VDWGERRAQVCGSAPILVAVLLVYECTPVLKCQNTRHSTSYQWREGERERERERRITHNA
jgi:hypothetical protein